MLGRHAMFSYGLSCGIRNIRNGGESGDRTIRHGTNLLY